MFTEGQPDERTSGNQPSPATSDATAVEKTVPLSGPYAGIKIKDRYRIERELGRGGFGVVYLARDEQLHSRPVVMKVLLEQAEESEWFTKKFQQEREALARIDHPGVVGVLDAGEMPDRKPFLVMQFVNGVTLRTALRNQEFSHHRTAHIVRRIGQALSAAHDRGVYHRDLKPENIMLQDLGDGEELVKIIDFGIATVKETKAAAGTEVTRVAGSGSYMAPEQLLGKPTSASDIYSLGVIAYEMITGRRPFNPESTTQLYLLQQEGVKVKPVDLEPNLPAAAQNCILKALSFDPKQRHPRARDFGEEFARALTAETEVVQLATRKVAESPGRMGASGSETVPLEAAPGSPPSGEPLLEMAHVLFMDIVGYSLLSMNHQSKLLQQLQQVVRNTPEFRRAQASQELISLPTGDGMALVFFRDPVAPVQCASEVSRSLKDIPEIQLRIGIHTGPVYRLSDINANRNVAGGGINLAQRVMDCGDAGHILLSRAVAEILGQFSQWAPHLQELGEHEVKHGVRVHLFNLCTDEVGNREMPQKLRSGLAGRRKPSRQGTVSATGRLEKRRPALVAGILALAVLLVAGIVIGIVMKSREPAPAPPLLPERMFSYSVMVQRYRDGEPFRDPFLLPGEIIFQADYRIRLILHSPQAGYLYMLNEGPVLAAGMPSFNVMFPGEGESASLVAGQTIRIPSEEENWIVFDEQEGTEKLWMVWSAESVPDLEAVKTFGQSEYEGVISDPVRVQAIQRFLDKYRDSPPVTVRDEEKKQTNVQGRGDVIVKLLTLEHH